MLRFRFGFDSLSVRVASVSFRYWYGSGRFGCRSEWFWFGLLRFRFGVGSTRFASGLVSGSIRLGFSSVSVSVSVRFSFDSDRLGSLLVWVRVRFGSVRFQFGFGSVLIRSDSASASLWFDSGSVSVPFRFGFGSVCSGFDSFEVRLRFGLLQADSRFGSDLGSIRFGSGSVLYGSVSLRSRSVAVLFQCGSGMLK